MSKQTDAPIELDTPKHLSVDLQVLQLLANQVSKVPWPVGAAALVVCIMAWGAAPAWALLGWTIAIWAVQAIRWRVLRRLPDSKKPMPDRIRLAVWLSGLNGICHALAVGFFPYLSDGQRSVLSLLLAGITTGAVGTTTGHTRIFHAFALPTMLSMAIGWAWIPLHESSRWIGIAMGAFLLAYQGILSTLARGAYGSLQRSIKMQVKQWRMNRELREALKQAEIANAAKTRFLASASHDLRQPLHTLTLFCAALETQALPANAKGIVAHMDVALGVLRDQLSTLLDTSKLDAGIVQAEPSSVDLVPWVEQWRQAFEPQAHQKSLRLEVAHDPQLEGPCHVLTDPLHLDRIVRNLLDNAIKYCDAGTVWLKIQVDGNKIVLIVQDTGRGIAKEEQDRIFEEFYQIGNPERDRSRGLGLGLSIVKRLAGLLNVPVQVHSEEGVGTEVTLTLQRCEPPTSQATIDAPSNMDLPACHVLLLDDEPAILMAMQTLLSALGCQVSVAETTDQAMTLVNQTRPDLVLADFRLRGTESGIKAIRKMRQRWPDLPALLISGDTAEDRLKEAKDAGLPLLHKPVSVDSLLRAMTEVL